MKRQWVIICAACFLLLFVFSLSMIIYNNHDIKVNATIPNEIIDPNIVFSYKAGFYSSDFDLELKYYDESAKIYYTLDGRVPTLTTGKEYTEPIKIAIKDKETAYIIRSVAIIEDKAVSPVKTVTYILGSGIEKRFTTAVVSITTDPANLNDKTTGIFNSKNLMKHGREFERPAHIEFFEPDGKIKLSQDCGIKVFGGATRGNPQKSLKLFARKAYNAPGKFEFEAFPNLRGRYTNNLVMSFDKLQLRNSGNDFNNTMFRDAFMQQLAKDSDIDYQEYRPTAVYLNGSYYGMLNLREDTNSTYIEEHYGIPADNVAVIASNLLQNMVGYQQQEGPEGQLKAFNDTIKFIKTKNMAIEANYQQASAMLDVDSFIRYMATQIYYANLDWPQNNLKAWRFVPNNEIPVNENVYGMDGRWRFILKDTDFGFSLLKDTNEKCNNLASTINSNDAFGAGSMLKSLLNNPEFKYKFINYICDIANDKSTPDKVKNILNEMQYAISSEIKFHFAKWAGTKSTPSLNNKLKVWDTEIGKMRLFADMRPSYLLKYTKEYFKLNNLEALNIIGTEGGSVSLNTVIINCANGNWSGSYFSKIPISISFIPDEGYIFEGYQLSENVTIDNGFIIINGSGATVTPIFTKDDSYQKTQSRLLINEIMASDNNYLNSDWVELYNNSENRINLNDYVLTDDINQVDRKRILPDIYINPYEYVCILCNGNETELDKGIISINFKLREGETVYLLNRSKEILDSALINTDLSFGRQADNINKFIDFNIPTPGAPNILIPYTLFNFPGLHNKIIVNGVLKDDSIKVVINEGIIYIDADSKQYELQEYANMLSLSYVYIPQYESVIFTKKV